MKTSRVSRTAGVFVLSTCVLLLAGCPTEGTALNGGSRTVRFESALAITEGRVALGVVEYTTLLGGGDPNLAEPNQGEPPAYRLFGWDLATSQFTALASTASEFASFAAHGGDLFWLEPRAAAPPGIYALDLETGTQSILYEGREYEGKRVSYVEAAGERWVVAALIDPNYVSDALLVVDRQSREARALSLGAYAVEGGVLVGDEYIHWSYTAEGDLDPNVPDELRAVNVITGASRILAESLNTGGPISERDRRLYWEGYSFSGDGLTTSVHYYDLDTAESGTLFTHTVSYTGQAFGTDEFIDGSNADGVLLTTMTSTGLLSSEMRHEFIGYDGRREELRTFQFNVLGVFFLTTAPVFPSIAGDYVLWQEGGLWQAYHTPTGERFALDVPLP